MRILLALFLMGTLAISCTKKDEATVDGPGTTTTEGVDSEGEEIAIPENDDASMEDMSDGAGIVEENNECICTKDFTPVCGSNGVTYPNACQAGCEGVTEFTDGACDAQ